MTTPRPFLSPRTCEQCGRLYRQNVNESGARFLKRRFCTPACYADYRRARALRPDDLTDELTQLREKLKVSQGAHRYAAQRAERAERLLSQLRREIAAERARMPQSDISPVPFLVQDEDLIEVTRLRQTLATLLADGETHAVLIGKVRNAIDRIRQDAEQVAGIGKGRRNAA